MRRAGSALIRLRVAGLIALVCAASAGSTAAQLPGDRGPDVKLVTPRRDLPLGDPVVIQALVRPARGRSITGVHAFVDDVDLGIRTQPPYRWDLPLEGDAAALRIRIVAKDDAGTETRVEEIITRFPETRFNAEAPAVTLNLAAIGMDGRFISDLEAAELTITDNGEPQEILDFAHDEAPLRISILVDRSNSMAGRMGETIAALGKFLARLSPDDQVKLMAFNEQVTSYTAFTNLHELVASFAQLIRPEGGTAVYDALLSGYREIADQGTERERRVIFLLTDGDDRGSRRDLTRVLAQIRDGGVSIFVLGQGDALDDSALRDVLREMADQTGGEAFFEADKSGLDGALERISAAMRALYLVSYRPGSQARGWHGIEVESSRPGVRLRHKPGYDRASIR